jgi:RecA/RadA recombinase
MDFLKSIVKELDNEYAGLADDGIVGDTAGFIDTGSYAFNALLSGSIYGGLPSNKVTALAGESSTGKTFYALGICKNFLQSNPEAGVVYFETEGALTRDMLTERGIDVRRFVIVPVSTVQEFRTQATKILDAYDKRPKNDRPKLLMCLDSLGMLSTTKEMEDVAEGKETRDMTRSQLVRGAFRVLSLKLAKLDIAMMVTNHTYAVIGAYVPTKTMGGGDGLKYAASTIVFLSKSKDKDGTEVIGNIIKCKLEKSRFTKEQSMVETKLSFSTGLDRYHGLTDLAIEAGIWKSQGGRIELPDGKKLFGKHISSDPTKYFTKELLAQIDEYCGKKYKFGQEPLDALEEGEELEDDTVQAD